MGRKTWDSIPPKFRPLQGRLNVVISRSSSLSSQPPSQTHSSTPPNPSTQTQSQTQSQLGPPSPSSLESDIFNADTTPILANSFDQALSYLQSQRHTQRLGRVFVIGGAQIYGAALARPETRRLLLTRVLSDFECDTHFPLALSESASEESKSKGEGEWKRSSKAEFDAWTGETVAEGVQTENGTEYEFQMWERVD